MKSYPLNTIPDFRSFKQILRSHLVSGGMSKTLFAISVTLSTVSNSYAQEKVDNSNPLENGNVAKKAISHRNGLQITAGFNVGYSGLDNFQAVTPSYGNSSRSYGGLALSSGIAIGGMFNDHFGLFTGYAHTAYQYAIRTSSGVTTNYNQRYHEIPVYARLVTSNAGKIGVAVNGGLKVSFFDFGTERLPNSPEVRIKKGIRSTITSIVVFPSINIPLGTMGRGDLNAGPEFLYSVNDHFERRKADNPGGFSGKLNAVLFRLSLNLRLTK